MKNICFLVGNLNYPGGTERVTSLIANELSNYDFKVTCLSICGGNKPFYSLNKSINVESLTNFSGRAILHIPEIIYKLRDFLKKNNIDTLIVSDSISILFSLPATSNLAVKHICWEHFNFNVNLGKKSRIVARHLAAHYCDKVVTLTASDKDMWLKNTKHKNQIITIPNPSPFKVASSLNSLETKKVLAVGRLVYQKGFDLLLKSWKEVIKERPDWLLQIVGEGPDYATLKKYIMDEGLSGHVDLIGKVDKIHEYYTQASIFCLSSRFEGFGMVLIEAISFGLPVVSFDCNFGPKEILKETGSILIPTGDTDALADALIDLTNDIQLRAEISESNLLRATDFQLDKLIDKWLNIV